MLSTLRSVLFNRWVAIVALAIGYGSVGLGCGHEHHDDYDRAAYHDRGYYDHHDYDHHDYDHHDWDRDRDRY